MSLSFLLFTLRGRAGGDICGEPWLGIATASWKRENRSKIVTNIDYIVMGSLRDDITFTIKTMINDLLQRLVIMYNLFSTAGALVVITV